MENDCEAAVDAELDAAYEAAKNGLFPDKAILSECSRAQAARFHGIERLAERVASAMTDKARAQRSNASRASQARAAAGRSSSSRAQAGTAARKTVTQTRYVRDSGTVNAFRSEDRWVGVSWQRGASPVGMAALAICVVAVAAFQVSYAVLMGLASVARDLGSRSGNRG